MNLVSSILPSPLPQCHVMLDHLHSPLPSFLQPLPPVSYDVGSFTLPPPLFPSAPLPSVIIMMLDQLHSPLPSFLQPLPSPTAIVTSLHSELFGEAVMLMEFLHTFGPLFNIREVIRGGITFGECVPSLTNFALEQLLHKLHGQPLRYTKTKMESCSLAFHLHDVR